MSQTKKEASFQPIKDISPNINSESLTHEIEQLERQIQIEQQKMVSKKEALQLLKMQEKKLDDDCMRYVGKLHKSKQRIEQTQANLGRPEYFLQENPHVSQVLEQMIIQQTAQEHHVNPDNMTYEQLLELGERIGKVSKGLTLQQMESLRRVTYQKIKLLAEDSSCSICCEDFKSSNCLIELKCEHYFHEECLVGWLKEEKNCPLCKSCVL